MTTKTPIIKASIIIIDFTFTKSTISHGSKGRPHTTLCMKERLLEKSFDQEDKDDEVDPSCPFPNLEAIDDDDEDDAEGDSSDYSYMPPLPTAD